MTSGADGREGTTKTFADRLNHLFATVHPANQGEFSNAHVASAISENARQDDKGDSVTISSTYIWQLRRGIKKNPTLLHMEALAKFFGVPPAYFVDDSLADRVDEQLGLLVAFRDSRVRTLATRASGLSGDSLKTIIAVTENARRLEGLPDDVSDDGRRHA